MFQANAFQVNAFQQGGVPASAPVDVDIPLGGGGFWDYHHGERKGERWKKRKKQLEALEARAAELAAAVPDDFPEARHARAAVALVERASDTLLEGQDTFDWSRLAGDVKAASAAIKRAEKAMTAYLAAVEEDDDDDFLMMV